MAEPMSDSWYDDKPITAVQYASVWDSAMAVQEQPSYSRHIVRKLLAEIDRLGDELGKLLEEKAEAFVDATTMFKGLTIRDGQAHLEIEPAREMVLIWCASVRAMLDEHQAQNYTETELEMPRQASVSLDIQDGQNPRDSYTLTLQRRYGKTPHQLRQQAERERDEARAELAEMRERIGEESVEWWVRWPMADGSYHYDPCLDEQDAREAIPDDDETCEVVSRVVGEWKAADGA